MSCTERAGRVGWGHHRAAATNFHGLEKLIPVFLGGGGAAGGPCVHPNEAFRNTRVEVLPGWF